MSTSTSRSTPAPKTSSSAPSSAAHALLGERAQQRCGRTPVRLLGEAVGVVLVLGHQDLIAPGAGLLARRLRVRAVQDLQQPSVVVDDIALGVQLQQPHRHRGCEPAQQLLAFLQCFLSLHLGGDIDDLDQHVVVVGVVEQVAQGRVHPHPRAVLAAATQARLLVEPSRQDGKPALDRPALVVGVDLVEHGVADELLFGVAEHLGEGPVAGEHLRALVLHQRAEAGCRRRQLLRSCVVVGLLVAGDDHAQQHSMQLAQIQEVQGGPRGGSAQQAHLVGRSTLVPGARPQPDHLRAIRRHHAVDQRATLDQSLAPQPDRLGDRDDQAVARRSAHERVRMLAQQRFGSEGHGLGVVERRAQLVCCGSVHLAQEIGAKPRPHEPRGGRWTLRRVCRALISSARIGLIRGIRMRGMPPEPRLELAGLRPKPRKNDAT